MTKQEFLSFAEGIYRATRGIFALTPIEMFSFKPADGLLDVSQVIQHLTGSYGAGLVMALTNEWPDMSADEMLPPAEKFPRAESVETAIQELDADWDLLVEELGKLTEGEFNQNKLELPWMPQPVTILQFMLQSAEHMSNHRMQLFIWLKLSGLPLHTGHLYGMP